MSLLLLFQGSVALVNKTLAAAAGSYALTGTDANLLHGWKLDATTAGSYVLTGGGANPIHSWRPDATVAGSYVLTGTAANPFRNLPMVAGAGSYVLTGTDAGPLHGWKLDATTAGSYALTGTAASPLYGLKLDATGAGSYALTGTAANLLHNWLAGAGAGSYALTGTDANLLHNWLVAAGAGSYALSGSDVSLMLNTPNKVVFATAGAYALTGTDASPLHGWKLDATTAGVYALTGTAASLLHTWRLVTGSRTNLAVRSQELDNASWLKTAATVTADATTAPDGTLTADAILSDGSAASVKGVSAAVATIVNSTVYTWSAYLKGGLGFTWGRLSSDSLAGPGTGNAWFNLSTGAIGTVTAGLVATMVDAGNGWYRCSISGASTSAAVAGRIRLSDTDNTTNATGTVSQGMYAWGAQLELGTTVSVYVPTTTTAVTFTDGPAGSYDLTGTDATLTLLANKSVAAGPGSYLLTGTDATLTYVPVGPPAVVAPTRGEWPEKKSRSRSREQSIHAARQARDSLRQSLERLYDGGDYDAPLEVLEEAQTEAMATVNALILLDEVPLQQLRAAEDLIRGIQELIRLRLLDEARIEAATLLAQEHLRETIDIAAQVYRRTRFDYLARYALLTAE